MRRGDKMACTEAQLRAARKQRATRSEEINARRNEVRAMKQAETWNPKPRLTEEEKQANREKKRKQGKEWQQANREKINERNRKRRQSSPEKFKASERKWRAENRDRILAKEREAYKRDPERHRRESAEYRAANREKVLTYKRARYKEKREQLIAEYKVYYAKNRDKVLAHAREYSKQTGHANANNWRKNNKAKAAESNRKNARRYWREHREEMRIKRTAHYRFTHPNAKPMPPKMSDEERRKRRLDSLKRYRESGGSTKIRDNKIKRIGMPGSHTEQQWKDLCKRFDDRCVCCGSHNSKQKLTRDHIVPVSSPLSTDNIDNIQPLCKPCNSRKNKYHTVDYRKTPFIGKGQSRLFA